LKRRQFYTILFILLMITTVLHQKRIFENDTVKSVDLGVVDVSYWTPLIAKAVNLSDVKINIDGKEFSVENDDIYISDSLVIMLPINVFKDVFICRVNTYEDGVISIEKGNIRVDVALNNNKMIVAGNTFNMGETVIKKNDVIYLPFDIAENAMGYSIEWLKAQNRILINGGEESKNFLPVRYDYREKGRAPIVKDQGSFGTCWAFASISAIESTLLPKQRYELSPDHMSINNSFGLSQNDGGEYTMSMAYLTAWQGPVLEEQDTYGDGYSPDNLTAVKHIQEVQIIASKDYEKIKEAVYFTGGVQSSFYNALNNAQSSSKYYNNENSSYCYIGSEKPNHDVVIIGWDDNYPKENFSIEPAENGAFICTNSWGEEFGESGFFYISYYDTNIGINNILYSGIEENTNYDNIYQADLSGWIGCMGYGEETAYFANVYKAEGDEILEAVGFYATGINTEYEVRVVSNYFKPEDLTNAKVFASGKVKNAGFYTIKLDEIVNLNAREKYAVIIKIRTPEAIHPIAIEYHVEGSNKMVDISDGEGYISFKGNVWESAESEHMSNICLKAYTKNKNKD